MSTRRPEFENPPDIFYNATEARKYTVSTRVQNIQRQMTLRALELLNIVTSSEEPSAVNDSSLLLDIGCGSGISGAVLAEAGHAWVGVDISRDMLNIAKENEISFYELDEKEEEETLDENGNPKIDLSKVKWGLIKESDEENEEEEEEDDYGMGFIANRALKLGAGADTAPLRPPGPAMSEVMCSDMGDGLPFRPGSFDGCVSISAIQWLCHVNRKGEVPQRRLMALFQSLYNCLRRGAKAVFQFYPSGPEQINMITRAAMKCGFSGGVVVDYPNSARAKKHYLVLQAGQVSGGFVPPPALTDESEAVYSNSDEEEDEEYDEEEDGYDDGTTGRQTRARVAGRDREMVKRKRARSAHQNTKRRRADNRPVTGTKEWVLLKKDERRKRGDKVTADSKYTMRPRKPRF